MSELARLAVLETFIEKNAQTVVEVAAALAEIRTNRLYKCTHATFQSYVEERFGFSRRWADALVRKSKSLQQSSSEDGSVSQQGEVVEGWELPKSQGTTAPPPPPDPLVAARAAFDGIRKRLKVFAAEVDALAASEHGVHLSRVGLKVLLKNVRSDVEWGAPGGVCPHEPFDEPHTLKCQCKGSGWIPKSQIGERNGMRLA